MAVTLRIWLAILLLPLGADALAQTFTEYLALRKKHGVTQAAGVEALETLLGTRILEVRGLVKGAMTMGDITSIMVERSDGGFLIVDGRKVPDWLHGNEIAARLLVKASRSHENAEVKAALLGAAPEDAVARHEALEARKRPQPPPAPKGPATSKMPQAQHQPTRDWNLPASQVTPYYAAFVKKRNPRLSNAQAMEIAQGIVGFSLRYGVDARLIMAMVMVESGFDPAATSHAGAMGLGQLMPGTAKWMGVSNAYDTTENLYGTVKLVRNHLEKYHRQTGDSFDALVLALAAYNAGIGAVRKHNGVPPYRETQSYVRKVISLYRKLSGQ